MKLIIAGGRKLKVTNADIKYYFRKFFKFDPMPADKRVEIIGGEAGGIDACGKFFAHTYRIKYHPFPADWDDLSHPDAVIKTTKFGKKYDALAGHRRNQQMANEATHLLLIWNGKSKGSADMKKRMQKLNKPVYEVIVE